MNPREKEEITKRYYRSKVIITIIFGSIFLLIGSLFYNFSYDVSLYKNILITIILSFGVMLFLIYLLYKNEKKYRNIEARFYEYLKYQKLFWIALIFYLAFMWLIGRIHTWGYFHTLVLINFVLLLFVVLTSKFEIGSIYLMRNARKLDNWELIKNLKNLEMKMGLENVEYYLIEGRKFKIVNAIQAGIKKYRVFIYDYLLDNLTIDECTAVIAHELAHIKMRHLIRVRKVILIFIFYIINASLLLIYIRAFLSVYILPFLLFIFVSPYLLGVYLRKIEKEADLTAAKYLENPESLVNAFKKLSELAFIPMKRGMFMKGTHPSLHERIRYIKEYIKGYGR